jgi:hypothetical protein
MPSSAIVFHQCLIAVYLTLINAKSWKKFLPRPKDWPVESRAVKNEKIQPLIEGSTTHPGFNASRRRFSPLSREFTPILFKAIHFLIGPHTRPED